jgi:hypothetical protein
VHVGWLDNIHPFTKGVVDPQVLAKLERLSTKPVEVYRGFHICELCVLPDELREHAPGQGKVLANHGPYWEWIKARVSNGEIRVSFEMVSYAAPCLITHYIEEHRYLPPEEFLRAVCVTPE